MHWAEQQLTTSYSLNDAHLLHVTAQCMGKHGSMTQDYVQPSTVWQLAIHLPIFRSRREKRSRSSVAPSFGLPPIDLAGDGFFKGPTVDRQSAMVGFVTHRWKPRNRCPLPSSCFPCRGNGQLCVEDDGLV